ncbi:MAG: M23 family metallopeptidase [Candidatus Paceibacterota bacterium]
MDLSVVVGTPVYAPVDGTAYARTDSAANGGFGRYVRIETAATGTYAGYKVYLAHLDEWRVRDGAVVRRGDLIGLSGNTGYSSGPHLHLEVRRVAGSPYLYGAMDPWPLIDWDPPRQGRRVTGVHLGNDGGLRDRDRETIRRLRPGCVVLLPSYGVNQQPVGVRDVEWILSVVPDCHIILRPYVPPSMAATDSGNAEYVAAVLAMLPEYVRIVPAGQLHLQLWNEQNMPAWSGWEGFGDQLVDMLRFDRVFCEAYERIKSAYPSVLIGWTPLTIGNRDAWFKGDASGHYYLHGPTGCAEPYTLTATQWQRAREESPCYRSLTVADEHYHHIYVHDRDGVAGCWNHDAYGRRYERYRYWWPEKAIWITEWGHPNKHFLEQPGMADALVQHAELLRGVSYIKGAALWLLGDNPQWGGEMYAPDAPVVARLAEVNAVATPAPTPEPVPVPAPYLPSTDPLTLAAIASRDPKQMQPKARFWTEEATRKLEANDTADALAILHDIVNPSSGLMYSLERALAP